MDHAEALGHIEIAAAEPHGLERLMAGDTPEASAVAGHLAGCQECAVELARLRRVADVSRAVIAEEPHPALRERTLAFVRALGVERPTDDEMSGELALGTIAAARMATGPWVALDEPEAAAGVDVLATPGEPGVRPDAPRDGSPTTALMDATTMAIDLAAESGTQVVPLAPTPAGGHAAGRLAFNGGRGELVVVATGLKTPGHGAEYGCWVETGGERRRIGTMYAAGDDEWVWSGAADGLDTLAAGAVFGVSLVAVDGVTAAPVLTGGL